MVKFFSFTQKSNLCNTEDLLHQIAFIKEIDKVKYIQRKTKLFNSDRNENDAEHSWHLALMLLIPVLRSL